MVGTDIVRISRLQDACRSPQFFARVFTQGEMDYWAKKGESWQTLAGMFAAKEAIAKALGTGISGFEPKDIEILHTENGMPYAVLANGAKRVANGRAVQISISHDGDYAIAMAVIV